MEGFNIQFNDDSLMNGGELPELSDNINDDLGFFLESPRSSPVKNVSRSSVSQYSRHPPILP